MVATLERTERIGSKEEYVQASLWDFDALKTPEPPVNVFKPEFKTEVVVRLTPVSLVEKYRDAIDTALISTRTNLDVLFPNAATYKQVKDRILEENKLKGLHKTSIRDHIASWVLVNEADKCRFTDSGKKRRNQKAIENASKRIASNYLRIGMKDSEAFNMLGESSKNPEEEKRFAKINADLSEFKIESKRLNKRHRQAGYFMREEADLSVWKDYISNQDRIDLNFEKAKSLNRQDLIASLETVIPREVRLNIKGRNKLRRDLIEYVRNRAKVSEVNNHIVGTEEIIEQPEASKNHRNKKLILAGLAGLVAGVSTRASDIPKTNTAQIELRSIPKDDSVGEQNFLDSYTVEPLDDVVSTIAPQNIIVDTESIRNYEPDEQSFSSVQVEPLNTEVRASIPYFAEDGFEIHVPKPSSIPRAAVAIHAQDRAAFEDPTQNTVKVPVVEVKPEDPDAIPILDGFADFGDDQPESVIKLTPGSNPWSKVRTHMQKWMGKFNRQPTERQVGFGVQAVIDDSGIKDAHNLPVGFELKMRGANRVLARLAVVNPEINDVPVNSQPKPVEVKPIEVNKEPKPVEARIEQPKPVEPAGIKPSDATGSGSNRFNITAEEIESLRIGRKDGGRYSCMELLDEIEESFGDLGRGAVITMNAITAAESDCDTNARSYAGSEGAPQIHEGSHKSWVEQRFGRPFSEIVRNPKLVFKVARQVFDWQGFKAWDVCPESLKPVEYVVDCSRLLPRI